jgi:prepilin-type N-terminal cleavage/methylation domain-containing protein
MKGPDYTKRLFYGNGGFSFIELSIVLIIIGILTGAGLLLIGKTLESGQRKQTLQRLKESKNALLLFAGMNGGFPETDWFGHYYQQVGMIPVDSWNQEIKYAISANVGASSFTSALCGKLKNPATASGWLNFNDEIDVVNYDAAGTGNKAIVALLLSGGARDTGLTPAGLLDSGSGSGVDPYVRKYPAENFDDLVVAITADEMYGAIRDNFCLATVEVTDIRLIPPLGGVYYVYNKTVAPLKPIGSANEGNPVKVVASLGDEIEIKNAGVPLTLTVGSNPAKIPSAIVADTRSPVPVPPVNPIMTVKIVDP